MSKGNAGSKIKAVVKLTNQGGRRPKTSSMCKVQKRSYKACRGEGR